MAKKAKKPAKVAKKTKPSAAKAKKPAKAAAKPAIKVKNPASKLVKKVAKKIAEKLLPKKKAAVAAAKPKKTAKETKVTVAKAQAKVPAKALAKPTPETLKSKKGPAPKTLQSKAEVQNEPAVVDTKAESKVIKDIILTDAEGRILCRVKDCDQPSVVESYCRYHYLFFWKKIQNRKKILSEGKLEQYIEELTSRYPLKFLELIRKDLSSEPDFMSAIQELDIDEASTDVDSFEDENFMEEVRGISSVDTERVDDEY
jgi:hypothetical protein